MFYFFMQRNNLITISKIFRRAVVSKTLFYFNRGDNLHFLKDKTMLKKKKPYKFFKRSRKKKSVYKCHSNKEMFKDILCFSFLVFVYCCKFYFLKYLH